MSNWASHAIDEIKAWVAKEHKSLKDEVVKLREEVEALKNKLSDMGRDS